ncbi:MAG TPA: ABC transporter permease [Methylovorus sp.]|nr:ABC transporter permease [Methylovorus sp.]
MRSISSFLSGLSLGRRAVGLILPLLLLLGWQYMSTRGASFAYAFSSVSQMQDALRELITSGDLQLNLAASLQRALTGLAIGGTFGLLLGISMASSRLIDTSVGPLYHILRQVPLMGLVPVFSLWLGNGDTAKLFIVCLSAFFPLVLATYESLRQVDSKFLEVGNVLKLSRAQQFRHILLPAALPNIFTGVSFALAMAWLSTIGSEILFNAGAGLGNLMMNAEMNARMDILVVVTILIGIVGYLLTFVLYRITAYLFRWRKTSSE